MITPRTTRLLRVQDLQAMHRVIAHTIAENSVSTAVVVPTAAAGSALRRTLGRDARNAEILTRDGLYETLHEQYQRSIGDPRPMLSVFEREVLLAKAAAVAEASGTVAPFRIRPGLIVEILAFYDELRRRDRTVADFDRLMIDSLQSSVDIDRGAERLFRQTQFLAAAFVRFEALVRDSGKLDEHALRAALLASETEPPFRRLILTVVDQAADPRGLWTADFDLVARLHGVESIDVIATENVLAAGFHVRVHDLLPGIEELRSSASSVPPVLAAPAARATDLALNWFVHRDREEELTQVARLAAGRTDRERFAVVFQRPLPYVYLARSVFADAQQSYQAVDNLPLAAEPFAAALDLVFSFLASEGNRSSTVDLLSSPHWRFDELEQGDILAREHVASLDAWLRESKYLGGWERLEALGRLITPTIERLPNDETVMRRRRRQRRVSPNAAVQAAMRAATALEPVRTAASASQQIAALLSFIRDHERLPDEQAPWAERHMRTRAAVVAALEALASATAVHDDQPMSIERLAGAVRRWIDGQTFAPQTGSDGVMLLDAPAAAYADVDEMRLVGLVESDWPERVRRSIFYPSSLLSQLGWPNESDRLAAARARFHDLLRLPKTRVSVSTFTLEDDAIVTGSPLLEEIEASGLVVERVEPSAVRAVFDHEVLMTADGFDRYDVKPAAEWLALRASRSPADADIFHGSAGPRPPSVYAVSHVERYLECPFKYFAARVLQLDEERDEESGLTAQERGQLLHEVFETFFRRWHAEGGKAITLANLPRALDMFATVAESVLARLPEADRALERTYLLGSAAAAGLGERAFNFEIEQDCEVLERLLEHPLEGEFEFTGADGPKKIRIRAKTDRIDLLEDGTLRVIDYKLGRPPKPSRALQLPIYGLCAEQHLAGRHGRQWTVSRAGYVAFKDKHAFSPIGASSSLERAMEEGAQRLVAAVDGIERGEFPVDPEEPYRCTWCGYAGLCRKDYVGDE